jgi:hypothetical protein
MADPRVVRKLQDLSRWSRILEHVAKMGWVTARCDDEHAEPNKPRRRYYRLTGECADRARTLIDARRQPKTVPLRPGARWWSSVIGFVLGVVVSIVTGALVNEASEVSPWLAQRIVRRAAPLWALRGLRRAEMLAEEWAEIIETAPGKLTKLGHALVFLAGAASRF